MQLSMFVLAAMTWEVLESSIAQTLLKAFGGDKGFLLMGMLFVLFVLFITIKAGAGIEASIVLSAFAVYLMTVGVDVTGSGQNNILPIWWLSIMLIGIGIVIYLAFFKREF